MEPSSNNNSETMQPQFTSEFSVPAEALDTSAPQKAESGPASQERDKVSRDAANQNAGMVLPKVVAQSADDTSVSTQSAVASVTSVNPTVADDVDVVEKEWVDKARMIVEQTKNDPYRQEAEVEKLQIDYIKKRYGRDIKPGNDT